jgi:hypothetical protein
MGSIAEIGSYLLTEVVYLITLSRHSFPGPHCCMPHLRQSRHPAEEGALPCVHTRAPGQRLETARATSQWRIATRECAAVAHSPSYSE